MSVDTSKAIHRKHLWQGPLQLNLEQGVNYGMKLSWDALNTKDVDLDLQALIVDKNGFIVDVVYYNNPVALEGAVASTGDMQMSEGIQGGRRFAETIWLRLSKVHEEVKLIIFVLAAYNGTTLKEARHASLNVYEGSLVKKVASFKIEQAIANADMVASFRRKDDDLAAWELVEIDELAESGSHFLDILEPTIGDYIRKQIPGAPFQKVSFEMAKGATVHLQDTHLLRRLSIGLGGEVVDSADVAVDIDIAAVFFAEDGRLLGGVDHENDAMFGVTHAGGHRYEHHEHFDEAISADLSQVPNEVKSIFLVLTIGNAEGSFKQVQHVYIRIVDQAADTLVHYSIPAGHNESGLLLARIFKCDTRLTKRWCFEAVGHFFSHQGTSWNKSGAQYEMLRLLHEADPKKVPAPKAPHGHQHEHHHDGTKQETSDAKPTSHAPKHEDDGKAKQHTKPEQPAARPRGLSRCFTQRTADLATAAGLPQAPAADLPASTGDSPAMEHTSMNDKVTLRKKGKLQFSNSKTLKEGAVKADDSEVVPVDIGKHEADDPESRPSVCNRSWFAFLTACGPARDNSTAKTM